MSIILPGSWGKQGPFGKWKVEGTTAAGDPYNGSLEVVRDSDELLLNWTLGSGVVKSGIGLMVQGKLVAARCPGPKPPGIVWYTLTNDWALAAIWTISAYKGLLATGVASPSSSHAIEGTRSITYFDPNGNVQQPANMDLAITRQGSVFDLVWRDPPSSTPVFRGVGLGLAQGLAAAWLAQSAAFDELEILVFTAASDNQGLRADAVSAVGGLKDTGAEVLQRV
jgi:hypothetical protein